MASCVCDADAAKIWELPAAVVLFACEFWSLLTSSVYLVGHELWVQVLRGVNDSGIHSTGFKNSHYRAFVALFLGCPFCRAGSGYALPRWKWIRSQ
jgi:hypothetical protein